MLLIAIVDRRWLYRRTCRDGPLIGCREYSSAATCDFRPPKLRSAASSKAFSAVTPSIRHFFVYCNLKSTL